MAMDWTPHCFMVRNLELIPTLQVPYPGLQAVLVPTLSLRVNSPFLSLSSSEDSRVFNTKFSRRGKIITASFEMTGFLMMQ